MVNSRCARPVSLAVVCTLGAALVFGCSAAKMEQAAGVVELPRQTGDVKVPLKGPLQIPSRGTAPSRIAATLAFQLAKIPNSAKLEMLVSGIRPACPLQGQPQGVTDLLVNSHKVTSFTLGPYGIGRTYRVMTNLEASVLKAGTNTLVINGLPCLLGNFEVVKINDVVVRIDDKQAKIGDVTEETSVAARPIPVIWSPNSPLPEVRRGGLPPRSRLESLVKRQLTDEEIRGVREKAVKFKKDIVLTGGLTETNIGLSKRYVVGATPVSDTLATREGIAASREGMGVNPEAIGVNRDYVAAQLGVPDWRESKPQSKLIDEGAGDVDIWEGSNLTREEIHELMRDVFPNFTVDITGYSKKRYETSIDLPGALVFRADGTIDSSILAPYQE